MHIIRTMAVPVPTYRVRWQSRMAYWLCLLLICSTYLQGGLVKAYDFSGTVSEKMLHFGLAPATPLAVVTIVGELAASFMILAGIKRWAGASYLAIYTLLANLIANQFWELDGTARAVSMNGFFEDFGLVGALLFVAWFDLCELPACRSVDGR